MSHDDDMRRTQRLPRGLFPLKTIPMVCSWCKKIYRIEKLKFDENQRTGVSHGICPDCLKKMNGQLAEDEPVSEDDVAEGLDSESQPGSEPSFEQENEDDRRS